MSKGTDEGIPVADTIDVGLCPDPNCGGIHMYFRKDARRFACVTMDKDTAQKLVGSIQGYLYKHAALKDDK